MISKEALKELGRFEIDFVYPNNVVAEILAKETEEYECIEQDLTKLEKLKKRINKLYNLYKKREKINIENCENCQRAQYNLGAFDILKDLKGVLKNER